MRDPLPTLLFSTAFGLWLAGEPVAFATSLYQCNTTSEGMIYTDNPAQLDGCVPITPSGEVSSLASTSSVYSLGEQPLNSTAVMHDPPAPPEHMPITPGHGAGPLMPQAMPSAAPQERGHRTDPARSDSIH